MRQSPGFPPPFPDRGELPRTVKALRRLLYLTGVLGVIAWLGVLFLVSEVKAWVDSLSGVESAEFHTAYEAQADMTFATFVNLAPWVILIAAAIAVGHMVCAAMIRTGGRGLLIGLGCVLGANAVTAALFVLMAPRAAVPGPGDGDVLSMLPVYVLYSLLLIMASLTYHPASRQYFHHDRPAA
jgi:hypothetical protein